MKHKKPQSNTKPFIVEIDITHLSPKEYNRKVALLNELMRNDEESEETDDKKGKE